MTYLIPSSSLAAEMMRIACGPPRSPLSALYVMDGLKPLRRHHCFNESLRRMKAALTSRLSCGEPSLFFVSFVFLFVFMRINLFAGVNHVN